MNFDQLFWLYSWCAIRHKLYITLQEFSPTSRSHQNISWLIVICKLLWFKYLYEGVFATIATWFLSLHRQCYVCKQHLPRILHAINCVATFQYIRSLKKSYACFKHINIEYGNSYNKELIFSIRRKNKETQNLS